MEASSNKEVGRYLVPRVQQSENIFFLKTANVESKFYEL